MSNKITNISSVSNIPLIPGSSKNEEKSDSKLPSFLINNKSQIPQVPSFSISNIFGNPHAPSVPVVPGIPGIPGVPGMLGFLGIGRIDPTKDLPHPSKNLISRKLNWSPLKNNDDFKKSFWSKYQEEENKRKEKLYDDFANLEKLFCEDKNLSKKNIDNNTKKNTNNSKVQLLTDRRMMNISISLSKIKFTPEKIIQVLKNYDQDNLLDLDTLQTIIAIFPNDEEIKIFKEYKGKIEELSSIDKFCYSLVQLENCKKILQLMKFQKSLPGVVRDMLIKISIFTQTIKSINSNEKFKNLLFIFRQVGNFLNHNSSLGKALGFSITSLEKISSTQSFTAEKITILEYIINYIKDKHSELLKFYEEFKRLEEASTFNKEDLDKNIDDLEKEINEIKKEKEKEIGKDKITEKTAITGIQDGKKKMTLSQFLIHITMYSDVKLGAVKISNKVLKDEIDKTIEIFALNPSKFNLNKLLEILVKFIQDFKNTYTKISRKEAKLIRKNKKKKPIQKNTDFNDDMGDMDEGVSVTQISKINMRSSKAKPNHLKFESQNENPQFKIMNNKDEFNKVRNTLARKTVTRKTVTRKTIMAKDLREINALIKQEKKNLEIIKGNFNNNNNRQSCTNQLTNKLVQINEENNHENNTNKVRITNYIGGRNNEEKENDDFNKEFFKSKDNNKNNKINNINPLMNNYINNSNPIENNPINNDKNDLKKKSSGLSDDSQNMVDEINNDVKKNEEQPQPQIKKGKRFIFGRAQTLNPDNTNLIHNTIGEINEQITKENESEINKINEKTIGFHIRSHDDNEYEKDNKISKSITNNISTRKSQTLNVINEENEFKNGMIIFNDDENEDEDDGLSFDKINLTIKKENEKNTNNKEEEIKKDDIKIEEKKEEIKKDEIKKEDIKDEKKEENKKDEIKKEDIKDGKNEENKKDDIKKEDIKDGKNEEDKKPAKKTRKNFIRALFGK